MCDRHAAFLQIGTIGSISRSGLSDELTAVADDQGFTLLVLFHQS
jgi:hypothetical protein